MSEPIRLAKKVAELLSCSRSDAEQYILGGWVRVDGDVVEEPQFKVLDQQVALDEGAELAPPEPATIVLHKPAAFDSQDGGNPASRLLIAGNRWPGDDTGIRALKRHMHHLLAVMPLDRDASGMLILTQDARLLRRMREDANKLEQEFIVEVEGEIAPYGLRRLEHGLAFNGRNLPPCKASWQSENRLRFAIKGVQPGQLVSMCGDVGLAVQSMKRIRIGRIPLAKMPAGEWRYLPADARL